MKYADLKQIIAEETDHTLPVELVDKIVDISPLWNINKIIIVVGLMIFNFIPGFCMLIICLNLSEKNARKIIRWSNELYLWTVKKFLMVKDKDIISE